MLDIDRNFLYFLNLQDESRRLSSYLFKVNIGRTVVQLEDGRTDGRNIFSSLKSNDETRQHRKISVVCSADVELQTYDYQPCPLCLFFLPELKVELPPSDLSSPFGLGVGVGINSD